MTFRTLFMAHAPDAEPEKHRCSVETGKYRLSVVIVRDQEQALATAKEFVGKEGIHSVLLCPGFTHADVAGIAEAVGPNVGVVVSRGDGPSGRATAEIIRETYG